MADDADCPTADDCAAADCADGPGECDGWLKSQCGNTWWNCGGMHAGCITGVRPAFGMETPLLAVL